MERQLQALATQEPATVTELNESDLETVTSGKVSVGGGGWRGGWRGGWGWGGPWGWGGGFGWGGWGFRGFWW